MKNSIILFAILFIVSSCGGGGSGVLPASPDTTKPVVIAPASITIAAVDATGATATNVAIAAFLAGATATDNIGVVGGVLNNAAPVLPLGTTTITFTAKDAANNIGTATSTITIADQTAPVVTLNGNFSATTPLIASKISGSSGNITDFQIVGDSALGATALDNVDGVLTPTGNAPSTLPLGTTNVTISATDAAGNIGTASTQIKIKRIWQWANPKINGEGLYDVVWAGTQYVAVGYFGNIMTSPDGSAWTVRNPRGGMVGLFGVAWSGTKLVVVGTGGTVLTSMNGIVWTQHNAPGESLNSVVWNGAFFVAVGNRGRITTSTDGITWTEQVSNVPTSKHIQDIAWSGVNFIAVGSAGLMVSSFDGTTWTSKVSDTTNNLSTIVYAAGKFVVGGNAGFITTSVDNGVNWLVQASNTFSPISDIGFDGKFFAVGGSGLFVRENPIGTWSVTSMNTKNTFSAVATSTGGLGVLPFIIVGSDGSITSTTTNNALTNELLLDVVWSAPLSLFVAVGQGGNILTSTNGVSWVKRTSGITSSIVSVIWTGVKFIALVQSGSILTSLDGVTWTAPSTTGLTGNGYLFYDITYSGAMYVIVGDSNFIRTPIRGFILLSVDGINWSILNSGSTSILNTVMWSGSQFVTGGGNSTLMTSTNGTNWTNQALASTGTVNDVIWTGTQYVLVGSNIQTSPDGAAWTLRNGGASLMRKIVWTGSEYLIVGNDMAISNDSITWTITTRWAPGSDLRSVAWSGTRLVGVGNGGHILYAQ